jgi:hypothetical protein
MRAALMVVLLAFVLIAAVLALVAPLEDRVVVRLPPLPMMAPV